MTPANRLLVVCVAVFSLATIRDAQASIIIGSSGLMTHAYGDQIESWLGEGPVTLTNIFSKTNTSTSLDFHAAADEKGRTIVLIEVLEKDIFSRSPNEVLSEIRIETQVIGGYNPQSWNSNEIWNENINDQGRNAFIFNLSTTEIQRQNLYSYAVGDGGRRQTYNAATFGPTFGAGNDIWVNGSLTGGSATQLSYGGTFTSSFDSIISTPIPSYMTLGLQYGRIEVYAISVELSNVPEPASIAMWSIGAVGMGLVVVCRRCRRAEQTTIGEGKKVTR